MRRQQDPRETIVLQLEVCANQIDAAVRCGLVRGSSDWRILLLLDELGPTTQLDICRASGLSKSVVSRATRALERARLAIRHPNPADSRSHRIVLSAWGEELSASIRSRMEERSDKLLSLLTQAECEDLHRILARLLAGCGAEAPMQERPEQTAQHARSDAVHLDQAPGCTPRRWRRRQSKVLLPGAARGGRAIVA